MSPHTTHVASCPFSPLLPPSPPSSLNCGDPLVSCRNELELLSAAGKELDSDLPTLLGNSAFGWITGADLRLEKAEVEVKVRPGLAEVESEVRSVRGQRVWPSLEAVMETDAASEEWSGGGGVGCVGVPWTPARWACWWAVWGAWAEGVATAVEPAMSVILG